MLLHQVLMPNLRLSVVGLVCGLRVGLVLQQAALAIARERPPCTHSHEQAPDSKAHGSEGSARGPRTLGKVNQQRWLHALVIRDRPT